MNLRNTVLRVLRALELPMCCVLLAVMVRQSFLDRRLVDAVRRGDVTHTVAALRSGANPNARARYENTPRDLRGVLEWVVGSSNIMWHDAPVLSAACQSSKPVETARALLDAGADPNAASGIGYIPLSDCVEQDKPGLVRLLLERGTHVDARTPRGDTALMQLAANGFSGVRSLPVLIEYGVDLHLRNNEGKTALQLAMGCRKTAAINILTSAGARE